jgi:hypothetical protein
MRPGHEEEQEMRRSPIRRFFVLSAASLLLAGLVHALPCAAKEAADRSKKAASPPSTTVVRPIPGERADLVVESFRATKTGEAPGGDRVRLDATVRNNGAPTAESESMECRAINCRGVSKVKIESTIVTGVYNLVCVSGVPALARGERKTVSCNGVFDGAIVFRATADASDFILETNEGNNTQSTGYTSR